MSGFFTGSGQNAADSENQNQWNVRNQIQGVYNKLLPYAQTSAVNSLAFSNQMQPYYQTALQRGIYQNTDQDALANAQAQGNNDFSNAATQAKQGSLALEAQGFGSGVVGGNTAGAYGDATNASNQAYAQAMSPEARQQRLMQRIETLGQTQNTSPAWGEIGQATSGIEGAAYGQPKVQVGQSAAGMIGGLAGDAVQTQGETGNLW